MELVLVQIISLTPVFLMSPGMIAATVGVLSASEGRGAGVAAYVGGATAAIILMAAVAFSLETLVIAAGDDLSSVPPLLDIAGGGLLVVLGAHSLARKFISRRKERAERTVTGGDGGAVQHDGTAQDAGAARQGRHGVLRNAGIGVGVTLTNFTSLAAFLAAAKKTADAHLDLPLQIGAMSLVSLLYLSPILVPLALTAVSPTLSAEILGRASRAIKKYGDYVVGLVVAGFGASLMFEGAKGLLA